LFFLFSEAISYLIFTELGYNFQTTITERVHVNATSPRGLDVEFDISLPLLPCSLLNIDANDPTGQAMSLHLDREHHVWKHRIKVKEDGEIEFIGDRTKLELGSTFKEEAHIVTELEKLGYNNTIEERVLEEGGEEAPVEIECGSCYGAGEEGECCNTCDDVKRAYNRKGWHIEDIATVEQCKIQLEVESEGEGCNVHGVISLSTGGGNFHVAPGRSPDSLKADGKDALTIFDILMKTFEQWNVSHTVNKIRFGDEYPGHVHQLEGVTRNIGDTYAMYQYYFQVSYRGQEAVLGIHIEEGEALSHTKTLSSFLIDCSNSIPIPEWHCDSNQPVQRDGAFAARQSWRWPGFARGLFLLRNISSSCGNYRILSKRMDRFLHICLCCGWWSRYCHGHGRSILAWTTSRKE
jgi:hypothetical protein